MPYSSSPEWSVGYGICMTNSQLSKVTKVKSILAVLILAQIIAAPAWAEEQRKIGPVVTPGESIAAVFTQDIVPDLALRSRAMIIGSVLNRQGGLALDRGDYAVITWRKDGADRLAVCVESFEGGLSSYQLEVTLSKKVLPEPEDPWSKRCIGFGYATNGAFGLPLNRLKVMKAGTPFIIRLYNDYFISMK